jgi:NitT/TauT family transport system substrate-binding protein
MIRPFPRLALAILAVGALVCTTGTSAQALDKLTFSTDWLAQAEHGGFYQALAEGTYKRYGLDVTVKSGGPQVNGLQLLAARQIDVAMADALQVTSAIEQKVPLVTIAATFQKNPTVIIAHMGVAGLADLKGKPVAVASAANTTFWPWLKERYSFTDDQKRPYAFSVQPFLVDKNLSQQGFATSEPFMIEKGGVKPAVFLLADLGYPLFRSPGGHPRTVSGAMCCDASCWHPPRLAKLSRQSCARQRAHQEGQSQMADDLLAAVTRR